MEMDSVRTSSDTLSRHRFSQQMHHFNTKVSTSRVHTALDRAQRLSPLYQLINNNKTSKPSSRTHLRVNKKFSKLRKFKKLSQ